MTKSQWLTCSDPIEMLNELDQRASQRKLRLFTCACCRRVADLLPDDQWRAAIEVAARFADGLVPESELDAVDTKLRASVGTVRHLAEAADDAYDRKRTPATTKRRASTGAAYSAALGVWAITQPEFSALEVAANTSAARGGWAEAVQTGATDRAAHAAEEAAVKAEEEAQADLMRDLFSDQFRPVAPHPEWFTSTVMALAGAIYDGHAFDRMPILADALQDAGCDNDDILNHCRGDGPHVRGCWVVDLVLGKEQRFAKLISMSYHGPWVLCSTPALKGRTATGFHSIKDDMVNAGATFVDKEVVVDGNVITSRKPDDLPAFVVALMEMMGKG